MANKKTNKQRASSKVTSNPFKAKESYRTNDPFIETIRSLGEILDDLADWYEEYLYNQRLLELCNTPSYKYKA